MPYIGNNHIAGDHTNNFKVLDDISSYTATFDGSATSVVDTTNNTIRVVEHRFIQGQRVTYTNGGGGNIGGLTTGTAYFIIHDSASTFKLATSASNAASSTAINLSAVGSGSSHTLNAAFDGVNTKFKLTHSSGTGARLNNATQVNVAINNVLQKPNQSASYTEGFIIEDNHKIAFKTAPTSEDIFWGSIIANTLTTFDISDHKIDTFTGDGSTTEFNLSHTPANNESLMVTINGVLQHPSNASTARAYTLIANVIQFTAAPGVGDEIQVRHMGFAGATTSDVTGFYGRTGNVVLTSNDHITTGNINAGIVTATTFDGAFSSGVGGSNANFTGIVTAGTFKGGNIDAVDGAFSGNVTIGGTLTYEDVSNIDSVGIVTAQKDVHVGAGLSVVGVSTLGTGGSGQVFLKHQGSTRLETTSTGIKAYGNDHLFTTESTGDCRIILQSDSDNNAENDNSAVVFRQDGSADIGAIGVNLTNSTSIPLSQELFVAASSGESAIILATGFSNGYNNAVERVRINNAGVTTFTENVFFSKDLDVDGHTNLDNVSVGGATTISNNLNVTASIDVGLDLDVDGHTNLDNVSVAGVTTMTSSVTPILRLQKSTSDGSVLYAHRTGNTSGGGAELRVTDGYSSTVPLFAFWYNNNTGIGNPAANTTSFIQNGNEKVRITSGGSVNIGGNFTQTTYTTQITSGNVNKKIGFGAAAHNDLSNEGSGIFFSRQSDGANGLSGIFAHTNSSLGIAARTDITLHAGGSSTYGAAPERVRITSVGHLGLGMTPDTWHANNQKVFQISGTNAGLNIFTRAGSHHLSSNFIYNSSDAGVFQAASGYAMHHAVSATNGTFDWLSSSAASSSAGSSATMINRLRITQSGNIGINQDTPTSILHVKHNNNNSADITIEGGGSGNAGLKFIPGGQTNTYFAYVDTNRNFRIQDHTAERLRIVAGGNILIGDGTTYNPQGLVHLVGDNNSNGPELYLQVGNNNTTDNIGALIFGNNVDKSICMIRGATHTANNTGEIQFHTSTTGTMSERLRITSHGGTIVNKGGSPNTASGWAGLEVKAGSSEHQLVLSSTATASNSNYSKLGFKLHPSNDNERVKAAIVCQGSGGGYGEVGRMMFCLDNVADNGSAEGNGADERLRISNTGMITLGTPTNTTLKAEVCNAVNGHYFVSQCDDNNNGFEIYQQHGSTSSRNTLAVYNNSTGSKHLNFYVRGDNQVFISTNKNSVGLVMDGTSSGTAYGETGATIDFRQLNEVNQFTGNPAARIASYLERGNNGFGLKFYGRNSASSFAAMVQLSADYEWEPCSDLLSHLGSADRSWNKAYIANAYPDQGTEYRITSGTYTNGAWHDTAFRRDNMGGLDLNGVYIVTAYSDLYNAMGGNYSCNYTWIVGMRNQYTNQTLVNTCPLLSVTGHSTNNYGHSGATVGDGIRLGTRREPAASGSQEVIVWRPAVSTSTINNTAGRTLVFRVQRIGRSSLG